MISEPDDAMETAGALFAILLAAFGLAVLAYMLMTTAAGAIECREQPGDSRTYWSYRIIEGNRCWYPGHGRKPKSQLHWSDEPKPKKLKGDPVFNQIRADASLDGVTWHMARPFDQAQPITPPPVLMPPDPEPECCWPDLNEFERRFVGVQP